MGRNLLFEIFPVLKLNLAVYDFVPDIRRLFSVQNWEFCSRVYFISLSPTPFCFKP